MACHLNMGPGHRCFYYYSAGKNHNEYKMDTVDKLISRAQLVMLVLCIGISAFVVGYIALVQIKI